MRRFILLAVSVLFITSASWAGEPSVEVAVIARTVEDRVPLSVSDKFPSNVRRLFCYSKIIDAEGQNIKHIWYLNDEKFAERVLSIGSHRFRTWGLVNIPSGSKGRGRVDITTEDGRVLKSVAFILE